MQRWDYQSFVWMYVRHGMNLCTLHIKILFYFVFDFVYHFWQRIYLIKEEYTYTHKMAKSNKVPMSNHLWFFWDCGLWFILHTIYIYKGKRLEEELLYYWICTKPYRHFYFRKFWNNKFHKINLWIFDEDKFIGVQHLYISL